ncbi:hypothetical protein PZH32_00005, partial [Adlercreutzia equolifaciens]|uniref:hypothetical protein n=1 Tax=Adlercreutzia equolifaciens TaxID=446660 RepID=UPI0023B1C15F
ADAPDRDKKKLSFSFRCPSDILEMIHLSNSILSIRLSRFARVPSRPRRRLRREEVLYASSEGLSTTFFRNLKIFVEALRAGKVSLSSS